ncbi:hypothetical protein F0L74_22255 [Chitinophaga agrisoli]|uniref:Uncharacterized protein n=1 Tax=Chitinophaga agrisoli TaxID=2607653 RepID=A0A5B2VK25_9BACT|nr:hypothetical protein [Chitinophaga agrisoli]KAA2238940.1 hypothetical protein F0L74_22255 [Chitinophaga agrisoli]
MKALKLFPLLIFILIIASCKKDNVSAPDESQDLAYKEKVIQLLHHNTVKADSIKDAGITPVGTLNLNFDTYKAAYDYVNSFVGKDLQSTDTIQPPNSQAGARAQDAEVPLTQDPTTPPVTDHNGSWDITYTANPIVTCTIQNTLHTFQFGLIYALRIKVHYSLWPTAVVENYPHDAQLAYTGPGTITSISPANLVTATLPTLGPPNTGKISGLIQGTIAVAGSPVASLLFVLSGGYTWNIPTLIGEPIIVRTTMSAVSF